MRLIEPHRHDLIDRWIGRTLKWGMALSLLVLLMGLALLILTPNGHLEKDLSWGEITSGVLNGDPIAVIDLGIVLLIATPLVRVITAMVVFIVDRDTRFVMISLIVLMVIAVGMAIG